MDWETYEPDPSTTPQIIYIGKADNLVVRHRRHERNRDFCALDLAYEILYCPVNIKGKKSEVEKFLLAEELNLIDLHEPVLNGAREWGQLHDRLMEKHGWRFGIVKHYRKKHDSDNQPEVHPNRIDEFDDPLI